MKTKQDVEKIIDKIDWNDVISQTYLNPYGHKVWVDEADVSIVGSGTVLDPNYDGFIASFKCVGMDPIEDGFLDRNEDNEPIDDEGNVISKSEMIEMSLDYEDFDNMKDKFRNQWKEYIDYQNDDDEELY